MTQTQFDTRMERAENGALVASKTDEGFLHRHPASRCYAGFENRVDFRCLRPMSWHHGMTSQEIVAAVRRKLPHAKTKLVAIKRLFADVLEAAGESSSGKTL